MNMSPPEYLNETGKAEWENVAQELYNTGRLSSIDHSALAVYCVAFSWWIEAMEAIEKNGLLMKEASGKIRKSPMFGIALQAHHLMHKYMIEFGMTPKSRTDL